MLINKLKKRWPETLTGVAAILSSVGVKLDVEMITEAVNSVGSSSTLLLGVLYMVSSAFRQGHTKDAPHS